MKPRVIFGTLPKDVCGMYFADKQTMVIDLHKAENPVATFIHELLHHWLHRVGSQQEERRVMKLEREIMALLTEEDIRRICERLMEEDGK